MNRVTVRNHPEVDQDLAHIYLDFPDPGSIIRASYEIDELLKVNPSSKGREVTSSTIDDQTALILEQRTGTIPEGLRSFEFGPLEVFFTASEPDSLAIIWLIRRADANTA